MYLSNLSVYIIVGIIATDFALGIATLSLVAWLSCRRNGDENDERLYQSDCVAVVPEFEDAGEIGVHPDGGVLGAPVRGSAEIAWGGVQEQRAEGKAFNVAPTPGDLCPYCHAKLRSSSWGYVYCLDWTCGYIYEPSDASTSTRGGSETSEGVPEAGERAVRGRRVEAVQERSGRR